MAQFVQSAGNQWDGTDTARSVVSPGSGTSGNKVRVFAVLFGNDPTAGMLSSSEVSGGFTAIGAVVTAGSGTRMQMFEGDLTSTGTWTVTLTPGGADRYPGLVVAEDTGVDDAGTPSSATGTGTAVGAGAVNIASSGYVLGGMVYEADGVTVAPDSGWTTVHESEDFSQFLQFAVARSTTDPLSGGNYDPAWTLSGSSSWAAKGAPFEVTGGGGGSLTPAIQQVYGSFGNLSIHPHIR